MTESEVHRLLAVGALERVEPDPLTAREEVRSAQRHLRSARRIADDDPTGAFAIAYDAMRKAIAAHMRAHGLRLTRGMGHHQRTGQYAPAAVDDPSARASIEAFEGFRLLRNQSEYAALFVEDRDVEELLHHAGVLVSAILVDVGA